MSAQAVKGAAIEKILSAAGQVVEAMNRNIDVMEHEKNALLPGPCGSWSNTPS